MVVRAMHGTSRLYHSRNLSMACKLDLYLCWSLEQQRSKLENVDKTKDPIPLLSSLILYNLIFRGRIWCKIGQVHWGSERTLRKPMKETMEKKINAFTEKMQM